MKLGMALHPEKWTDAHLKMARQLGCETVIAWVPFGAGDGYWHLEDYERIRDQAARHGLVLEGIENFHPQHIDHVVLDEPGKEEQMANLVKTVENAGRAGMKVFGYNFSCCGVQGYYAETNNTNGRGAASIKMFDETKVDHSPLPSRRFWFNTEIERRSAVDVLPPTTPEQHWARLKYFLENLCPIAEKYGMKLCAHPDDPPIDYLKGTFRPLTSVEGYSNGAHDMKKFIMVLGLPLIAGFASADAVPEKCAGLWNGRVKAGIDVPAASLVESWEADGRVETLRWFEDHQFGKTPIGRPADERIGERSVEFVDSGIRINISCCLPKGASAEHPVPVFLFMDHRGGDRAPDYPQEEYAGIPTNAITSRGYAYVRWNGNDVCPNASRYTGTLGRWPVGIVSHCATGNRSATNVVRTAGSWGTIGAWAWGNSRVMDWIETRPELDARRVAVLGHSRGGKTALWTGAQDTRFALTISNGSGCGGARLGRAKDPKAETFGQILHNFPNWFCPAFAEWIGRDAEIPHDADDLIRLIAPRLVYVASGSTDAWAGPRAEKAAWDAAHDLYRAYGHEDRMGYHCHEGPHKLRADDWEKFMDFADAHWTGAK